MSSAAVAAAAAVARGRRRVVESFRENGATSPVHAMPFHPLRRFDQKAFDRFMVERVIVPIGSNCFFLDEEALRVSNERRRTRALTAIGVVVVISVFGVLAAASLKL